MSLLGINSDRYMRHTERVAHWFPFIFYNRPTVLYFLDNFRYGKYFDHTPDMGGTLLHEDNHKIKWNIQMLYQSEMEQQGKILREIFLDREATEDSKVIDYLLWIDWQWTLYEKALIDAEYQDEGFIRFVQSDLSYATEIPEIVNARDDTINQIS